MRNPLPFHNSKEVILSHLCPSTVRVLVLLFLECFIFLCKASIICVNFFHSYSFSEFSYVSSFCAIKLHAISYIIRFDLIAAILDIELLIP